VNGSQQLVGALGVGLIGANAWTGPQRAQLTAIVSSDPGDPAAAHTAVKHLGAEVLGVAALVLIAGSSEGAGHVAALVLVALWVLFLIRRTSHPVGNGAAAAAHPQFVVPRSTGGTVAGTATT
jgi:hypothetical protein